MLRTSAIASLFLIALGIAQPLDAQTPAPGASVRVWSRELRRRPLEALFGSWTPDSLQLHALPARARDPFIAGAKPAWIVSRRSVTRFEELVPRTRGQGAATWALAGGTGGALTGLVLGALAAGLGAEYYPHGTDRPGVSVLYLSVPAGAAVGAALGAVAGAAFPGKRWRRVPLPE